MRYYTGSGLSKLLRRFGAFIHKFTYIYSPVVVFSKINLGKGHMELYKNVFILIRRLCFLVGFKILDINSI